MPYYSPSSNQNLSTYASLASPALTGVPTAPTAAPGANSTQVATTAYADAATAGVTVVDATTSTKGKVQLAGDLGGTAALPTVKNIMRVFNVKDVAYGAVGDGTTVDTTAVTAAITALNAAGGGILLFPQGGNYVLDPAIQISSNTHIINQGTITLNPAYTNVTSVFKGIFRLGGTGGTDIVDNVEIEGGLVVGDAFTAYTTNSPTFNANNHKYVCYVHSVATHRNVRVHDVKVDNMGSPVTFEKLGGNSGTPSKNVHCYNITEERIWVGVQYYCNGYAYQDVSVHDITVKFCYDDCVAIVGATAGIGGATGLVERYQVYNIRGEKTGQLGAFVKLDATGGILTDGSVHTISGYTDGVNEYLIGLIGETNSHSKKHNWSDLNSQGTWKFGIYAQTYAHHININNFNLEALYDLHFQGTTTPNHYQSIKISNGVGMSRSASVADTIEGYGIGYSAGTGSQGFQNVQLRNVGFFDKLNPIYEGASVPTGTGSQGTYANFDYDVDLRDNVIGDCSFSATTSRIRYSQNGLYIGETAPILTTTLVSPNITTPTGIVKGDVGLGNVDNTSDATKNAATATLTNKTLTDPIIANLAPAADLTLTQNSVAAMTSISAGATANTLYLKAGFVGVGTTTPAAQAHVAGPPATIGPSTSPILILDRPFNTGISAGKRAAIAVGAADAVSGGPTRLDFLLENVGLSAGSLTIPPINVMTLLGSGFVGIGVAAPTSALHILEAGNIQVGTTTGTKIGTATTQKLGFYNATPVVQQLATTDLITAEVNLGLRAAGTAVPITTTGAVSTGSLTLGTAGNKLNITTGANASAGTGTLVAGTATISTTAVTANSLIFLTDTSSSLTNLGSLSVSAKSAGTSFTVISTNILDTATFNWMIVN